MLRKNVVLFGLLGGAVLVLLNYSRFALWQRSGSTEWLLAGGAAALLALGFALRSLMQRTGTAVAPGPSQPVAMSLPVSDPDLSEIGISEREYDVLTLMAQGLSNREIADRLFIAESTVKTHVSNLFGKLNARRRTEAIQNARLLGIV